jgi:RHS repeat-associated protein
VLAPDFSPRASAPLIPFTYTGREWEPEVRMYFFRARFMDPRLGRFISQDPIGFDGGLNGYAYVGNNPVNFTDPAGLVRWGALGSATLGLVTNGLGVATAAGLALVPEPTMVTKVAAGVVGIKSFYGLGANGINFYDASVDKDPTSKAHSPTTLPKQLLRVTQWCKRLRR